MASMARAVVGAVMSLAIGTLLLWFIIPMLNMVYQNFVLTSVDLTLPGNQQLVDMGTIFFNGMGLMVFAVTGYLAFAYATERRPFDTGE